MKSLLCSIILLVTTSALAKPDVEVFYQKTADGYEVFATNQEFCPVSIDLDFHLENLAYKEEFPAVFIVPARTENQFLISLEIRNKKKGYGMKYVYRVQRGDVTQQDYDREHSYRLPYSEDQNFPVLQGYNGKFSHQGQNALDFKMPSGTQIRAIRSGTVVKVVESNTKSCPEKACAKFNNYIIVYHRDGSFAEYTHIEQNGAHVTAGDEIVEGQIIASSGNVGWSTAPHLHLEVFLQRMDERETLRTKFRIHPDSPPEYLSETKVLSRVP